MTEVKFNRAETLQAIIDRDGPKCRVPGCRNPYEYTEANPQTIEHVTPRCKGGTDDLDNLEVAHQKCNSWKGDREYIGIDENGERILEPLPTKDRANKVVKRPPCETCFEGHLLLLGEVCPMCGSGPQPIAFPNYAKRDPKDCNHSSTHCWGCVIGLYERVPASSDVFGVD